MTRVLDRNGVQLSRGIRVFQRPEGSRDARHGTVVATVGLSGVLVLWEDAQDDEYVEAATLATASAVRAGRRRRP